jgi:hypothetical protein
MAEKYVSVKTIRELIEQTPEEFLDKPLTIHVNGFWCDEFQVRYSDDHGQTVFELSLTPDDLNGEVYITN